MSVTHTLILYRVSKNKSKSKTETLRPLYDAFRIIHHTYIYQKTVPLTCRRLSRPVSTYIVAWCYHCQCNRCYLRISGPAIRLDCCGDSGSSRYCILTTHKSQRPLFLVSRFLNARCCCENKNVKFLRFGSTWLALSISPPLISHRPSYLSRCVGLIVPKILKELAVDIDPPPTRGSARPLCRPIIGRVSRTRRSSTVFLRTQTFCLLSAARRSGRPIQRLTLDRLQSDSRWYQTV